MSKEKKLTAAQRIEGLENALASLGEIKDAQTENINILTGQIDGLRQTIAALARRLNATIKSGDSGNVNSDVINRILV